MPSPNLHLVHVRLLAADGHSKPSEYLAGNFPLCAAITTICGSDFSKYMNFNRFYSFIFFCFFVCSRNFYLRPCPLTICSFFSLRFFSFLLCLLLLFPFAKRPRLQCSPNRHKQTSKCITIVDNRIAK